jgi:hypothetical protein
LELHNSDECFVESAPFYGQEPVTVVEVVPHNRIELSHGHHCQDEFVKMGHQMDFSVKIALYIFKVV